MRRNGQRSHCSLGLFWNGNFYRSVLERLRTERTRSHYGWRTFQNGGNGPDAVVGTGYKFAIGTVRCGAVWVQYGT